MYTIDFGIFPFAGLLVGGCLYVVYYWGLRLHCQARWAQTFIVAAMVLTTVCAFVSPSHVVQHAAPPPVSSALQADDLEKTEWQPVNAVVQTDSNAPATEETYSRPTTHRLGIDLLLSDGTSLLGWLYLAGFVVMLLYFAAQIAFLHLLRGQHEYIGTEEYKGVDKYKDVDIYQIPATHAPFSFGCSIFIPAALGEKTERYVLMHEMAHVRHRHYLWLCLLEVLLALNWYNPFVWLLFREMHLQQEFEVDADMIDEGVDREEYQLSLVSLATRQGKWILTRSAFFGEPLKKRLLFMNTAINWKTACIRLAASVLLACTVLTVVACVSGRMRTHEQQVRHPFQGCWALESVEYNNSGIEEYPSGKRYKFVGDYGDLTIVYHARNGNYIRFGIGAMEQRLQGDTLVDVHGRPIEYELKGDLLKWRWHILLGEEVYEYGKNQLETWRRTTPDPLLVELLKAVTYPEQDISSTRELNGVWQSGTKVTDAEFEYLIINEPYYMWIAYWPTVNEQTFCFDAMGYCGDIHSARDIHIKDYHRVPMPPYLRRMFQPALIQNQ